MNKICKKCLLPKSIFSFSIKGKRQRKDGSYVVKRGSVCRRCVKLIASANSRCIECSRAVVKGQVRCEIHRQRRAQYANERYAVARRMVFAHYGQKCCFCGQGSEFFLTIDHINDDGIEHRKKVPGSQLYFWLVRNKFPDGFQTLCYNCNGAKAKMGVVALLEALANHGIVNAANQLEEHHDTVGGNIKADQTF